MAERGAMAASQPLLRRLPRGDGHPVLVLPGFVASDRSTAPLRRLLGQLGYEAFGWDQGQNIGPTAEIISGLVARFESIARRRGRPITLVGWSLGGIYSRELARRFPDTVRQVVTLGSPIQMGPEDRSAASRTWDTVRHLHDPELTRQRVPESEKPPLDVPATSIYTRTDGVVHWRACLIERTPRSENVEVYGSHCGLGFNPWAMFVLADRLAQPAHRWEHFRAPLVLRGGFPRAADLVDPASGSARSSRSASSSRSSRSSRAARS